MKDSEMTATTIMIGFVFWVVLMKGTATAAITIVHSIRSLPLIGREEVEIHCSKDEDVMIDECCERVRANCQWFRQKANHFVQIWLFYIF